MIWQDLGCKIMTALETIETQRLMIQQQTDAGKTSSERNKLGQYATPSTIAGDMLTYARSLLTPDTPVRFLDPAFGTGAFYSALLQTFPPSRIADALAFEVDPLYGQRARELWTDTGLRLHLGDFTKSQPPIEKLKANLLICNPPYVRHHHLAREEKKRLQALLAPLGNGRLSELAGLYCYFLLLSHAWMANDGVAGWLVPSEFMDVNYGRQIKAYLLQRVSLLRVHTFDPNETQFQDALVSSSIIWFRNASPASNQMVEFTSGGSLLAPKTRVLVTPAELRTTGKWSKYTRKSASVEHTQPRVSLSDLFTIHRGLATGANNFFVLTHAQINEYGLPRECFTPVLPSARYLPVDEIEATSDGKPILKQSLSLLTCDLPEDEIRGAYPSLWRYLQKGVKLGVSQGYLCSYRTPWYSQEKRAHSPLLCTYMGRQSKTTGKPFRFILNHSQALATNSYLLLYPKPILQRALDGDPQRLRSLWQAINRVGAHSLIEAGRTYGGGLHKLEPKELASVPADEILATTSDWFDPTAAVQPTQMLLLDDSPPSAARMVSGGRGMLSPRQSGRPFGSPRVSQ